MFIKLILGSMIYYVSFCALANVDYLFNDIIIEQEIKGNDYNRKRHFGDWTDVDADGQSTRQEVLADESLIPVTWSPNNKKVISGLWYDPFTAKLFTEPNRKTGYAKLQIDHIVPLKEAWQSGAKAWTKDQRVLFANDMENSGHLIAVRGGTNGSKGFKDPAEWLPPNENFHCAYVITWTAIKVKWKLSMDEVEHDKILEVLSECKFER